MNEYTILCGRCKKQKLVPLDRTLKARREYFKKSMWLLGNTCDKLLDFPGPLCSSLIQWNDINVHFSCLLFYILEHFDTACVKQTFSEQKSTVEVTKMRSTMEQLLSQADPATNASQSGPNNVDYDCDRDEEIDCCHNTAM